jgi:hypothetical protein
MMPLVLHPSDITGATKDTFRFYNLLPSDDYTLAPDWPRLDLRTAGEAVARGATIETLDALTLCLLASREAPLPGDVDWTSIADACARGYSRELGPNGQRPLRMSLARANFMLRDLLDLELANDCEILEERRFEQGFVWDWLPLTDGEVIADSRQENIHHLACGHSRPSVRLGLPTQVDPLSDGRIAVGSCYSDGWHAWNVAGQPESFARVRPVVLVFEHGGHCWELDVDGVIRCDGSKAPVVRLPIRAVWCARRIGDFVFASDWGDAGMLAVFDLRDQTCHRISSGPVLLTNDICWLHDQYYVLDKMQGRVFAFDESFSFRQSRMRFGKSAGRLYDPISIRPHLDNLHVLSWITGSLVTIRPF